VTTYAHREIVVRRIEYGVAAGCTVGDLHKVLAIAWQDYASRNGIEDRGAGPRTFDDWAEIHPRDEETVIAFTVEVDAAKEADRVKAVLDLVDRADALGWDEVLRQSGDDIPQAIRRILQP
jgi:hypothetical protein